jgi:hypothetical protein
MAAVQAVKKGPEKVEPKKAPGIAKAGGASALKLSMAGMGYAAGRKALSPQPEATKPQPEGPVKQPEALKDLPDPEVVTNKDTKAKDPYAYKKNDRGAKLYGPDGVQAADVRQGAIGDCFLAAALAAVASADRSAIEKALKDNGDGTFTVTFYEVGWTGEKKTHQETVDADLPFNLDMPAYAKSTEMVDGKAHMELWPSILEKAYAQWKGSYDAIGHGGVSGDVMTALTGKSSRQTSTSGNGDALWEKMKKATEEHKPMTAGSGGKDDERYKDPKAGVYGWHAYTILGVEEKKEGDKTTKMVTLRNPWGKRRRDTDATAVGEYDKNIKDKGVFTLTYDEFRKLYDNVTVNG